MTKTEILTKPIHESLHVEVVGTRQGFKDRHLTVYELYETMNDHERETIDYNSTVKELIDVKNLWRSDWHWMLAEGQQ